MPRKKIEENQIETQPDFTEVPAFSEDEENLYEPNMAPLAKEDTSENVENTPKSDSNEKTGVFIKLTGGGSFTSGEYFFQKGKPVPVPLALAEKLMKSGFFDKV